MNEAKSITSVLMDKSTVGFIGSSGDCAICNQPLNCEDRIPEALILTVCEHMHFHMKCFYEEKQARSQQGLTSLNDDEEGRCPKCIGDHIEFEKNEKFQSGRKKRAGKKKKKTKTQDEPTEEKSAPSSISLGNDIRLRSDNDLSLYRRKLEKFDEEFDQGQLYYDQFE